MTETARIKTDFDPKPALEFHRKRLVVLENDRKDSIRLIRNLTKRVKELEKIQGI